jgi:hypothetical protein
MKWPSGSSRYRAANVKNVRRIGPATRALRRDGFSVFDVDPAMTNRRLFAQWTASSAGRMEPAYLGDGKMGSEVLAQNGKIV